MKKLYLYLSLALVLAITLALFKLVFLKEDTAPKTEPVAEENINNGYITLPRGQENEVKYTGKVIPARPGFYMQGSHELVDKDENRIVFLEAKDDKLTLAEGQFVGVRGKLGKTVEGDAGILTVSSIIFK